MSFFKRQTEVAKPPTGAKRINIPYWHGGHLRIYLIETKLGVTLYIGGGTPSEPIFKIEHSFQTKNEALYYARIVSLNSALLDNEEQ